MLIVDEKIQELLETKGLEIPKTPLEREYTIRHYDIADPLTGETLKIKSYNYSEYYSLEYSEREALNVFSYTEEFDQASFDAEVSRQESISTAYEMAIDDVKDQAISELGLVSSKVTNVDAIILAMMDSFDYKFISPDDLKKLEDTIYSKF